MSWDPHTGWANDPHVIYPGGNDVPGSFRAGGHLPWKRAGSVTTPSASSRLDVDIDRVRYGPASERGQGASNHDAGTCRRSSCVRKGRCSTKRWPDHGSSASDRISRHPTVTTTIRSMPDTSPGHLPCPRPEESAPCRCRRRRRPVAVMLDACLVSSDVCSNFLRWTLSWPSGK